jgi:hypothetical protein
LGRRRRQRPALASRCATSATAQADFVLPPAGDLTVDVDVF